MATKPLLAITILLLIPNYSSSFNSIFLSCGSPSSINFASDNPPRIFDPDDKFLSSSSNSKTQTLSSSSSSSSSPSLYSTARYFTSSSSYSFNIEANSSYILRLHFFPFNSTLKSNFDVTANSQPLLSSFSPPISNTQKEFFLFIDKSTLLLTFSPASNNLAFINSLELISSGLIAASRPTYLTTSPASQDDFFTQPKETLFRLNIGGGLITPANDTLWRTWETDDGFLSSKYLSVNQTFTGRIKYPTANGLTQLTAPDMVYATARTLDLDGTGSVANANFNLTWSFDVPPASPCFVRLHFCNCWFQDPRSFYFEVYIGNFLARKNLYPGNQTEWDLMVPFFDDFVVDSPKSGTLNISIGPAKTSVPPDVLLNGLEIMKVSNFITLPSTKSHKDKHLLFILLPSILIAIFILILLLSSLLLRRCRRPTANPVEPQTSLSHYGPLSKSTNSASMHLNLGLQIPFAEILFATNNFDNKLIIGAGGFGKVYKGVLHNNTKVAVKRGVPGSGQGYPQFQTEIVVLSRIRHRHLVSLVGYCEENSEMILVYEYMEKGTFRSFLYGNGPENDTLCLSWKQRLEICICAAKGLHYLHTGYSQSIIHRDVKSTNILIAEDMTAKVSDFGLSRLGPACGETHVSTGVKGTFGYFDPEYFKIQKVTEKSDVYSFGVVMLEALCARPPIVGNENLAELAAGCMKRGEIGRIVDGRLAGEIDENSLRQFGEIAGKCLAEYGVDRPSIGDVLWNLEYALQLQVTGLLRMRRELFDDSVVRDEESLITVEKSDCFRMDLRDESDLSTNLVFSQLITGEGR